MDGKVRKVTISGRDLFVCDGLIDTGMATQLGIAVPNFWFAILIVNIEVALLNLVFSRLNRRTSAP